MTENYKLLRNDKNKQYCFLDAETENLGLHEVLNLPWQISMAIARGNNVERELDFYIKWPQGINVSKDSARITNYNPSLIESKGLPPLYVLAQLDKELREADIIAGHNLLGFEAYIVQALYRKLNKKPINIVPKVLDTFPIAKAIKLEIQYNKQDNFAAWQYRLYHHRAKGLKCSLGALGKEYEIEHDYGKLHNALNDCQLNVKVWNKQKLQIDI